MGFSEDFISKVREYFVECIEDFELRSQLSLNHSERWRCPMDEDLEDEMREKLEEYCEDNDIDLHEEYFYEDAYDPDIDMEEFL